MADANTRTAAIGGPGYVFDPFSQEFADDPYPTYRWMRDEAPAYHQPEMNFWVLSRYEDVWKAHRDAKAYSSKAGPTIERNEGAQIILLGMDAPKHNWAKAMMAKVFSRERMDSLNPFIQAKAAALLETCYETHGPDGEFNMVSEFSVDLPLAVISELLGIPEDLRGEVHDLANAIISRQDGHQAENEAQAHAAMFGLFFKLTQERRKQPKDDPVSLLIALEVEGEDGIMHKLSDMEIAMRFVEMAAAGHETVAKAIPNGAIGLEQYPDQKAKLIADLSLVPKAVQEILRYDPPSQLQGRITTREIEIHGQVIPEDSRVMLATGAATHDPRAFPDPDRFDIERDMDGRSVYFGFGVHKCLGIHLAQQEIAIAMEELCNRFPKWKVFPDRAIRPILSNVRGASYLPIVLGEHA